MLGKIIAGRYEILEHIAGGGMAAVYQGRDNVLDRIVAVKVMDPQLGQDDEFVKRFILEAQATGRLSHPNIVNVYDAGEEEGMYYMVMEFVEGITLKEYIIEKGFISAEEAAEITAQICDGLAHAHKQGIIHRDIKPHNILCTPDGRYKLTDFGIARLVDAATHLTKTGTVMGSVHYFSPEQASGHNISYPSDLYSLGVVLFEMLTGSVPFDAKEHILVAMMHLHDEVPDPRLVQEDLPESFTQVLNRVLAKKPEDRYQSAEEFKTALLQAPSYNSESNIPLRTEVHYQSASTQEVTWDNEKPEVSRNSGTQGGWHEEEKINPPNNNRRKYTIIGLCILLIIGLSLFFWSPEKPNADENNTKKTEQTSNTPSSDSSYIVVVSSFQHRENAEKLVEKLGNNQFDALIAPKMVNGKKRYRVYLGNFIDKDSAQVKLDELRQTDIKNIQDAYITKINSEKTEESGS